MPDEEATLLAEVRDLMGDPELEKLRPAMFAVARAHDREVLDRRADRAAQRTEYVRLQGVQVAVLTMVLTLVGLLVKAL